MAARFSLGPSMLLTSGWCVCLRMGLSICTWPRLSSKPSLLTCSTQLASTTRAGRRRRIDDALARQMLGQGTPRRLAAREGAHFDLLARRCGRRHLRRRLGLGASSCMSASLSSSCSITAPRSEDCPNHSCLSLAIVNFICSISRARVRASASALRAFASASRHAACAAITIAFSVAAWSGRESGVGVTLKSHGSQCRTQPAACGRHVCCGARQSIPSSR